MRVGKLIREKDSKGNLYKEYKYENGLPSSAVIFAGPNEIMREINYTYNSAGKLIIEDVKELSPASSTASHIKKYEY